MHLVFLNLVDQVGTVSILILQVRKQVVWSRGHLLYDVLPPLTPA